MFNLSNFILGESGLSGMQKDLVQNWIGPIFLVACAVFALKALKDQQWMKLATFIAMAAVVGLIIFNADKIFGSGGNLTKVANNVNGKINMIQYGLNMRRML